MAHIDVTRAHALGPDGARQRAVQDLRRHHNIALEAHWEGDTLVASGRGFKARLLAGAEAVRVTAELGMFLRPFRGRIHDEVQGYLHHYLDGASRS